MGNGHCNVAIVTGQHVMLACRVMLPEGERTGCPPADAVRAALEQVLASPGFVSKRRGELLRYLVERTLAGEAEALSEYSIALDVFHKPESFDSRRESTIRAEMSRVRKALAEYYEGPGAGATWRFEFPAGGYAPSFVRNGPEPVASAARTPPHALRWSVVLIFLVLASGAAAWWRLEPARPAARSVIVLPFVNLTGDSSSDYLADGLTEGLTDALARIASLRVVARTSAFQYKGKAIDIRIIGQQVHADAVIEGSLRRQNGQLLVTVQVNRAADGYHLLSRVFQDAANDESRIQSEMVLPVLSVLRPNEHPPGATTPDPGAFDLVLRARVLRGYGTIEEFDREVGLLDQAIQKDPRYAAAYAELASAYAGAATNALVDATGAVAQVDAAAARAIELDPSSATAYAARGYVHAMVLGDWKRGEDELQNALRLMPQDAAIHQRLGLVLLVQGRFQPALAEVRAATELDPLVPAAGTSVGMVYFMERSYQAALKEWRNLAGLHPDAVAIHGLIGMALEASGDYGGAMKEYEALAAQDPVSSQLRMMHLLAVCGQPGEARQLLGKLAPTAPGGGLDFAATYAALGERDQAFAWLQRACDNHSCWMLKVHPFLDPLRGDPRYARLLKRAGFTT